MSYENPDVPEAVNYSQDHPLRELAILLAGALALVVLAVVTLSLAASWLARQVPFEVERAVAEPFAERLLATARAPELLAAEVALQALAIEVARDMGLPDEQLPVVHVVDDDMVNAFATLGGHLVFTRRLLAQLPHENALVTVLAHEIAHLQHRDPVVALGRGVAVTGALAVLGGVSDGGIFAGQMQQAGLLTVLAFNRDQERAADEVALAAVQRRYGHASGAADLFVLLQQEAAGREPPAFLSTHPPSAERLARMRAAGNGAATVPLPAVYAALATAAEDRK